MGTRSYGSLGSFIPVASGLQSVAVGLFFSFLVTYSARLIFHFCVADLIATRSSQPSLYHCWTKDILSKRKGIYILKGYFSFPTRRQGNAKKKKKKKTIIINFNLKLIKYKFSIVF